MPRVTLTYDCPAEAGDLQEALHADELASVLREIWWLVRNHLKHCLVPDEQRTILAEVKRLIEESPLEGYP